MRKLPIIALMGAASLFMFSCKEDEGTAVEPEIPKEFSELTVEANKAQLEDNGIKMVREMEAMKDLKVVGVAENLVRLLAHFGQEEEPTYPGGRVLKSVGNLRKGSESTKAVFSSMRLSEEPESIQGHFDENAGTYAWNAATEEWDYAEGSHKIVFKFPATEGAEGNNAVLTISDYQGKQVSNPIDDDYTGDLPTNLLMNITVDGVKVLDYSFKADYNSSGEPTSLNTSLSLAPFSFEVKVANDTKKVTADYTFKKDATVLIAMGAGSEGNFASSHIENSEDDPGAIVNTASAYVQVMNIKVAGTANVKDASAAVNALPKSMGADEKAKKVAEIVNSNYELAVFYADSKEKIAETEFYAYTETYTYWDDANGDGTFEEEVEEYLEPGLRLVFADGSKSEFENYFETGFDDLFGEVEDLIESME